MSDEIARVGTGSFQGQLGQLRQKWGSMIGSIKQPNSKRTRGVVLTPAGLKRLQAAIETVEIAQNKGERMTLDELGERMNVSTKTLSRMWSLNTGVDSKTLKLCFSAFNLKLSNQDYTLIGTPNKTETEDVLSLSLDASEPEPIDPVASYSLAESQHNTFENYCSYPDGPVTLDSPFYIERRLIEELAYREVTQPGGMIRIRAPREMGKSSLVLRLLAFAETEGYRQVIFNCNQIDSSCLGDLNNFLRCLCKLVALELGIKSDLNEYWDEEIGCKLSCSFYFHHLLKQCQNPVVLVLNEVDYLFERPQLAQEFFGLLRSWYEQARFDIYWQKLRLVVVYSTEEYVNLDINRSPFNVGLPLRLPEFTRQEVQELAQRHGLDWSNGDECTQLMSLVAGHPALIRIALYCVCYQGMTLEHIVQEAIAEGGIYRYHLWRHWTKLQEYPNLVKALAEVLAAEPCPSLHPLQAYKLEGMGLIRSDGDRIRLSYELYRAYFKKQLSMALVSC